MKATDRQYKTKDDGAPKIFKHVRCVYDNM